MCWTTLRTVMMVFWKKKRTTVSWMVGCRRGVVAEGGDEHVYLSASQNLS